MSEKQNGIPKIEVEEGSSVHKFITAFHFAKDLLIAVAPVLVTWVLTKGRTIPESVKK